MRVLHITETMASGVLKYLQEIVGVNENEKYDHYVLYSKREYTPIDVEKLFPDTVHLIYVDIKIKSVIDSIQALYTRIKDINPDIIHLHSSIAGFLGRIVTLLFPKVKVFYTPHGYSFLMTNKSILTRSIYWLAESLLSQFTGRIIACSKSEYQFAKTLSPFRKVFLLENCIKVLDGSKDNYNGSNSQIIGVGRMEEQKNPRLFIEIAAELKRLDASIKAVWIGDGTLKNECEELNRSLQADVTFTGWLSNEETLAYLQKSTVFLQTSKWEGLPYSVLEALAVGVPVVASDIQSHRDLIGNNYTGFIAKSRKEYVSYTSKLLNNPDLRKTILSTNQRVLKHNYDEFCKRLNTIYGEGI